MIFGKSNLHRGSLIIRGLVVKKEVGMKRN